MKRIKKLFWNISPTRALAESLLVCLLLLFSMFPILLEAPPLPLSLFLVLLPLVCSMVGGLRTRFFNGHLVMILLKESLFAALLSLGLLGIIYGLFSIENQMDSIQNSYSGPLGTVFFILMAAPEYLGIRLALWMWRRWNHLRSRRFAWALTHAILTVLGVFGLLALSGMMIMSIYALGSDIWGIPPDSAFARSVFWLSILVLFSFFLIVGGIGLFLPPATLFSFLVARKMTVRLENLASATQALRRGNLGSRVQVDGKDEIAQLQTDFNAMATDLEKTMLDLQAEKDKVLTLLENRRELVAGISHELRNPIAIMQGYIDSLQSSWQDRPIQEVTQDLETIQYETARLKTILNDLLAASQLEAGRLQIALQPVNVTVLLRRLEETFSGLAWKNKRVQVTFANSQDEILALADPVRLEQVLVNLVQNAVQHTSPGGLVAIEAHRSPESVCIEVEDTGKGIPPEDLLHIWEKYYHSGSTFSRNQYGAGLGLSLVKELTEAMGGTVSVESWPGQGSVFRLHLEEWSPKENTV